MPILEGEEEELSTDPAQYISMEREVR